MMVLRWIAKPRLNYFDAFVLGLAYGLWPHWGWWVGLFLFFALFASVAFERAVKP